MNTDQVKALLGPPNLRELKGNLETWHYIPGRKVVFDDGQVVEFGIDDHPQRPVVQVAPSPTPASNLEIGQACKADKECKLRNCHFHVCAGANNCNVPLGQICAVDNDCCSGHCDFGYCKSR